MGALFTYTGDAAKTKEAITSGVENVYINTIYEGNSNFYWYINSKGYIHVVQPLKINFMGEFSHFEIIDYLLNNKNTLKESCRCGHFKTAEEAREYIKNDYK